MVVAEGDVEISGTFFGSSGIESAGLKCSCGEAVVASVELCEEEVWWLCDSIGVDGRFVGVNDGDDLCESDVAASLFSPNGGIVDSRRVVIV